MTDYFSHKDNEFIAWYPPVVFPSDGDKVWHPRASAFYVHIPFCTAICDYCGFAVQRERDADPPRYVSALHREIERYAERDRFASHEFVCGHFGGGTPSVLPADQLLAIKRHIESVATVTADAEITVEVNPISFTAATAQAYQEGGVNRISVGIQSFDDELLRVMGRPHRATNVVHALEALRSVAWENFSLDIIYGVPGQTPERLRADLRRAADTGAAHLSCFRLEIIPFTALKLREAAGLLPPRLTRAELDELDEIVSDELRAAGYREYGAFNFARPGFESRHNDIAFMAPQSPYLGFGNSAYSYANGHIYCNDADVPSYVEAVEDGRDPIAFAKKLTALEEMSRYFVLGLKFFRVPRAPFIEAFGMTPEDVFGQTLDGLTAAGMLTADDAAYHLTRLGRRYVNNVCKEFYVGENRGARQQVQFIPTLTPSQILGYARRAGLPSPEAMAVPET